MTKTDNGKKFVDENNAVSFILKLNLKVPNGIDFWFIFYERYDIFIIFRFLLFTYHFLELIFDTIF